MITNNRPDVIMRDSDTGEILLDIDQSLCQICRFEFCRWRIQWTLLHRKPLVITSFAMAH